MSEFLGWSNTRPTEPGYYWWKPSVLIEDWKAVKITEKDKDSGVWKPCIIK